MIKSIQHATEIQANRAQANKRGYAKSVRRYLSKHHSDDYQEIKATLPVAWPQKPKPKKLSIEEIMEMWRRGQKDD